MDGLHACTPIDCTVRRGTPAEVAAARQILRTKPRPAVQERGQTAIQSQLRGDCDLVEYIQRRVVRQDGHDLLIHDRAGVGLFHHHVKRGAGFVSP